MRNWKASDLPSWKDMVTGCRKLTVAVPELVLPQHTLRMVQIRPFRMPRGWSIHAHKHSFYEASVILQGAARTKEEPQQELTAGHVYFHGPGSSHSWGAPSRSCLRILFWFSVEPNVKVPVPMQWPQWPVLLYDIAELLWGACREVPGWRDQAAARLGVILSRILTLGDLPSTPIEIPKVEEAWLRTVDAFLADNLQRSISLADVAACAGVSLSTLIHKYHRITGGSIGQKLLSLRMEAASHLLTTTSLPLKAICAQVGIEEPAYFCRLFKRYFRATPSEYRIL